MRFTSPGARVGHAWEKVRVMKGLPRRAPHLLSSDRWRRKGQEGKIERFVVDLVRVTATGRLGYSVAEVGSRGRENTIDVSPGTRVKTSFWMQCGVWEHESQKVSTRGET